MNIATRRLTCSGNTMFLTGSGSVRLSAGGKEHYATTSDSTWIAFNSAVRRHYPQGFISPKRPYDWLDEDSLLYEDFLNSYSTAKSVRDYAIRELCAGKPVDESIVAAFRDFFGVRKTIANEFELASEERWIELRADTFLALAELVPHLQLGESWMAVTTNWDTAWQFPHGQTERVVDVPYFQIHGSAASSEQIYMPSDSVFEDFPRRALLKEKSRQTNIDKKLVHQCSELLSSLRSVDSIDRMARSRGEFLRALQAADCLIVWGLAFNNEDIELRTIVRSVAGDFHKACKWPKTVIIDLDSRVRDRVASLLQLPAANRFDLDPRRPDYLAIFSMRNI